MAKRAKIENGAKVNKTPAKKTAKRTSVLGELVYYLLIIFGTTPILMHKFNCHDVPPKRLWPACMAKERHEWFVQNAQKDKNENWAEKAFEQWHEGLHLDKCGFAAIPGYALLKCLKQATHGKKYNAKPMTKAFENNLTVNSSYMRILGTGDHPITKEDFEYERYGSTIHYDGVVVNNKGKDARVVRYRPMVDTGYNAMAIISVDPSKITEEMLIYGCELGGQKGLLDFRKSGMFGRWDFELKQISMIDALAILAEQKEQPKNLGKVEKQPEEMIEEN